MKETFALRFNHEIIFMLCEHCHVGSLYVIPECKVTHIFRNYGKERMSIIIF
jgi:hypothetical protein